MLKNDPRGPNGLLNVSRFGKKVYTLQQLVAAMAPNMDVAIEVIEDGNYFIAVGPNDWLDLDDEALLTRLNPLSERSGKWGRTLMRPIKDTAGKVFGRAFIRPERYEFMPPTGWVTVGGLRAKQLANVQGVLLGEVLTVVRDSAVPTVSKELLADWATNQAELIAASSIDEEQKAKSAEVVIECGGQPIGLPIAKWGDDWVDEENFRNRIATLNEVVINFDGDFSYDEDQDEVHPRDFRDNFRVGMDIIVVPKHDGVILKVGRQSWPNSMTGLPKIKDSNLAGEIRRILTESWGNGVEHWTEEREVGTVDDVPISRDVDVFTRDDSDELQDSKAIADEILL